jgi:hypothetical protein
VYNSRLKSNHSIKERSCVRFVDVDRGQEEKIGQSWKVGLSPLSSTFMN